ncbi:signal peptidase I [Desulfobotulus alkaliphilus]|uniref:Signal peptidase I n=2 Tax=Desulfobotulus alkaliphilus TaxID=622671 RepID=A0A562S7P0_9BACT|nr:signal peptidase I [Desulfobotulus alkaliphilus]TWI77288.1 signal peptidase I [Desulfobotulus alkaliphilus]
MQMKPPKASAWRENVEAIVIAVVLALMIRTFAVQAFKIPSGSMLETLQIGDHILVNKLAYGLNVPFFGEAVLGGKMPGHGDVIVFAYPEDSSKDFIKRVVGVEGDVIEIRDKQLYRNGEAVRDESYAGYIDPNIYRRELSPRDNMGPVRVPEGKLFTMGDNRDSSSDSRFWGYVDIRELKGRAFMIYWSWDGERMRPRWDRLGNFIS